MLRTLTNMNKVILILSVILLAGILTSGRFQTMTAENQTGKRPVYHVIFHTPGIKWVDSLSFQEQSIRQTVAGGHVDKMSSYINN